MRRLLYYSAAFIVFGSFAWAQPVSNPSPVGAAGAYNSSPPTCTAGNFCWLQTSSVGRLLVDAAVTGGGDATAANQVLQITQETAINTILGTVTASPTANTISDRLKVINTTLGTPMQMTGGTVGLVAGSQIIGNVRIDQTTPGTTNGVQVNAALPAGSNIIGNIRIDQTTPGTTNGVVATLAAETTKVIGTVNQGTSPWVVSGAVTNAGTFATQAAITAASGSFASGSQSIGITPTDRTITSATGSSQTVMSSNASRKSLTLVNTGNANCGINPTGGTAAIGGAGTLTLAPFGAYTPRVPSLAAITAICTAAQTLYADES